MTNKWILGSTISTLMGIFAAVAYLVMIRPQQSRSGLHNHYAEWLLWFFLLMVVVSMLVNLMVLIAPPARWSNLLSVISGKKSRRTFQLSQYQEQVQSFFLRHQLQLKRLTGQAEVYLWMTPNQSLLLQFSADGTQQANIEEMRLLFRWMLTHQCRQGFYVSLRRADLQAEIFAKEAGIQIIDLSALQNLDNSYFSQKP
jgi:hypothetical protein